MVMILMQLFIYLLMGKNKLLINTIGSKQKKEEIENKLLEMQHIIMKMEKKRFISWLRIIPCTNIANNIDALFILRQYGKLIKTLNITTMRQSNHEKDFF